MRFAAIKTRSQVEAGASSRHGLAKTIYLSDQNHPPDHPDQMSAVDRISALYRLRRYGMQTGTGERVFDNESQEGRTMQAMRAAAETDPLVAERVDLFLHRVPEEFYDFENDPNALQSYR